MYTFYSVPNDPPEGQAVLRLDSSGNLKVKIRYGGQTKTATLVDFGAPEAFGASSTLLKSGR